MRTTNLTAFNEALVRLREADILLDNTDAGVCLIHLEACIAALESRIRRHGMTVGDKQGEAANDADHQLTQPITDPLGG